jgi:hypothetical protein
MTIDSRVLVHMIAMGFTGLAMGCFIDVNFMLIQSNFSGRYNMLAVNIIFFILQMCTSIIILWYFHKKYIANLSKRLKTPLPAMILSTTYFGIQSNLFLNIQILYKELLVKKVTGTTSPHKKYKNGVM